jgi:hypothetical protein
MGLIITWPISDTTPNTQSAIPIAHTREAQEVPHSFRRNSLFPQTVFLVSRGSSPDGHRDLRFAPMFILAVNSEQ